MANKIDTIMSGIETALKALVTSGVLKQVLRGNIDPLTVSETPTVSLLPDMAVRSDKTWDAQCYIMVVCAAASGKADQEITEVMAKIEKALDAHADGGTAGCNLDVARIDYWYHIEPKHRQPVGAVMTLRMRFGGPLLTS